MYGSFGPGHGIYTLEAALLLRLRHEIPTATVLCFWMAKTMEAMRSVYPTTTCGADAYMKSYVTSGAW